MKVRDLNILGLSFDYHDSAAALISEGTLVAAAHEERFTRIKNDPSLPASAAAFCLAEAGLRPDDLDHVVFYERPLLKFDRILQASLLRWPASRRYFQETLRSWTAKGKFHASARISDALGVPLSKVHAVRHHAAHAASAFFCSPFDEAAVVTLDGVGEYETGSIWHGRGSRLKQLARIDLPNSLGLFYAAITAFLGFKVNEDEYKVMGMAAYGEPIYFDEMRGWFALFDDGTFALRQDGFEFLTPEQLPYTHAFIERFGSARVPESPFALEGAPSEVVAASRHYANFAASAQRVTEEVMLHMTRKAVERTGVSALCLAGGVALNSLANGRIKKEVGSLYIHPAAGDAGGSLGAAAYYHHVVLGKARMKPVVSPYLGLGFSDQDIRIAFDRTFTSAFEVLKDDEALIEAVVTALIEGRVVGWVQGRAEWGPRALGNRSIIADPRRPEMQRIVNEKIKFREPFRPFAPAVLEERAHEFFEIGDAVCEPAPEHFMLAVCRTRPDKRAALPAVTHVDGTARLQLVSERTNPLFHRLVRRFGERTGVPVVMNTSFNLRGEPIVNTPLDAIRTFEWCDMDLLAVGRYLIQKAPLALW